MMNGSLLINCDKTVIHGLITVFCRMYSSRENMKPARGRFTEPCKCTNGNSERVRSSSYSSSKLYVNKDCLAEGKSNAASIASSILKVNARFQMNVESN